MSDTPLSVDGRGTLSPTSSIAPSSRPSSRTSGRPRPQAPELWGPYGPLGRCPSLATNRSNRLVSHRPTFVDESLFRPSPGSHVSSSTAVARAPPQKSRDGRAPASTDPAPVGRSTRSRRALSATQRAQTRHRMVGSRASEVDFGLFAPMSASRYWTAMEDWYGPDDFSTGKQGFFDTEPTRHITGNDVRACLTATKMTTRPAR